MHRSASQSFLKSRLQEHRARKILRVRLFSRPFDRDRWLHCTTTDPNHFRRFARFWSIPALENPCVRLAVQNYLVARTCTPQTPFMQSVVRSAQKSCRRNAPKASADCWKTPYFIVVSAIRSARARIFVARCARAHSVRVLVGKLRGSVSEAARIHVWSSS